MILIAGMVWWLPSVFDPLQGLRLTACPQRLPASSPTTVALTLNHVLELREVQVQQRGGIPWCTFPVYQSRRGVDFPQVTLLTYGAQRALARRRLTPSPAGDDRVRFRVNRLQLVHGGTTLKALATVTLNGVLAIELRVLEGRNGLWVAWPARPSAPAPGRGDLPSPSPRSWVRQVEVLDWPLRRAIERTILAAYHELAEEAGV